MPPITQSSSSLAFLLLISALAVFLVYRVFRRLKISSAPPGRLVIGIAELGGFGSRHLILISLLSLFVEMLMIRWVSSEIRIFAYFKNFVLVACFLGFGLGCYLCRRRIQLMALTLPLLLLTAILKAPISPLRRSMAALPQMLGASVEVHVWGVPAIPTSWTGMLLALCFVVPLFAVIATAFIPFGQLVGWYLENSPKGVAAYSVKVLACLAGMGVFTLCSFLHPKPWVWFLDAVVFLYSYSGKLQLREKFWESPSSSASVCSQFPIIATRPLTGRHIRSSRFTRSTGTGNLRLTR